LIATLGGAHVIDFSVDDARPLEANALADLPSVQAVRGEAGGFTLSVREPHVALPALLDRLETTGHSLAHLTTRHASLEDVFVTLTGRHLRDDEGP
jgi:ABC-2 type transport system ATP-binding protein